MQKRGYFHPCSLRLHSFHKRHGCQKCYYWKKMPVCSSWFLFGKKNLKSQESHLDTILKPCLDLISRNSSN